MDLKKRKIEKNLCKVNQIFSAEKNAIKHLFLRYRKNFVFNLRLFYFFNSKKKNREENKTAMIRIGTCSWKYDSWKDIIYTRNDEINYLTEYSKHFNTVEIDQWFWSLFENKVLLPQRKVVEEYKNSVPDDFLFTIKVPNSLTLTHFYNKDKSLPPKANPNFLSFDLYEEFLNSLKPLENQIGSLIFQFEYLNKQKMSSLKEFENKLYKFHQNIPETSPPISIEIRNPNYLNESYFNFLNRLKISHVFLEGYFMPPLSDIYNKHKDLIKGTSIIRLHGPDRKMIEKMSGQNWNKIYINRDKEINAVVEILKDLQTKEADIYLNVNNHFEGSAPLTINKIKKLLEN